MSKIYLSGASGFVGKNLVEYLTGLAHEVKILQLRSPLPPGVLADGGAVIHLAGKAHDLRNSSDPREYYQVNFELTKRLYDAFLESRATKFIFLSSVKAAADHTTKPLTEMETPDPVTHYGKSKLMAEQYIQDKGVPPGKSFHILRPCIIHGPGNKGNLNLLYKLVSKGIPYPLAAFQNRRSFLSIENLCFAIQEIIVRNDIQPGIYNIADDIPISTNRMIQIMAATISKKEKLWNIPRKWVTSIARIGDWIHLPLNSERLKKLTENYVVNNKKLIAALKKPLPLSSEEGLQRTIQSFMHDQ